MGPVSLAPEQSIIAGGNWWELIYVRLDRAVVRVTGAGSLVAVLVVLACAFGFAAVNPPAVLAARPGIDRPEESLPALACAFGSSDCGPGDAIRTAGLAGAGAAPARQATPDLTVIKSNNVGGLTTVGSTWTWTFAIRNQGTGSATFTTDQVVLLDNLPDPNVSYPSVTSAPFGAPTGTLVCAVGGQSNLTCRASGGNVVIPAGSGYDITMQATTPVPATYTDPRAGGVCQVDPNLSVAESRDDNNFCGDTVTVVGPDLTVAKTNNVGGLATVGAPWTWTITIRNEGVTPASFTPGQRLLLDTLPNASIIYSGLTVAAFGGALPNLTCDINPQSFNLACQATAGDAIIPVNGGYVISFQAVASAPAVYANPRANGTCAVDPDSNVAENSETNNACSNTVTVPGPDLVVVAAQAQASQATAASKKDDDDKPDIRRLTQAQRRERERTNKAGEGDYRTEGFVVEVRCDASAPLQNEVSFPNDAPYLVIATVDGKQQLRLLHDARSQCQSVQVGDYAEADGEKEHELLFDAHNLTTSRR